ncbi:MAG: ROK family protein [Candidatus Eisenbacteria bacterium]
MRVLVIDIGGSNVKVSTNGLRVPLKIPSGPDMTPRRMAAEVKKATRDWSCEVVSIGYPGPVANNHPAKEPSNLAAGWVRFDYRKAFGKPVKIMNDAAMQALGSYQGGRMLFLGLGTGLGSAFMTHRGAVEPLELAHLPYRDGKSYEDFAGERGLKRLGAKRWTKHVHRIVELLQFGLQADYVMLGGGQTKKLKRLPVGARLGNNGHAIRGGLRLWDGSDPQRQWRPPHPVQGRRFARPARSAPAKRSPRSSPATRSARKVRA